MIRQGLLITFASLVTTAVILGISTGLPVLDEDTRRKTIGTVIGLVVVLLPFIVSLKGPNFLWWFLSLLFCIVTAPIAAVMVISLLPQQHALSTKVVIAMWCLGALTWVIAWVFAGISLASKSRQQHG
jgi:Na+/proline symporter